MNVPDLAVDVGPGQGDMPNAPSGGHGAGAGMPLDRAEAFDWLRLARSRNVGPGSFRRLLSRYGSAGAAVEALPALAARGGRRDYVPADPAAVAAELEAAAACGARMLRLGFDAYPAALARIGDAPPLLWASGNPALATRPCTALVGARNASALGLRMAGQLAGDLGAAGHVIVSGLARGIDTAAHQAAIATGTIAVLAGGLDQVYPEENTALAARIAAEGLLLSEAAMGSTATARHFPRRNRIVSGLCAGVVLIEAAARSGSLVTARTALDQGREVMAVPGAPLDARAEGCNQLIRQGAALIRHAEDVQEALAMPSVDGFAEPVLAWLPAPDSAPPEGLVERLVDLIGPAPVGLDDLAQASRAEMPSLMQALTELDLAGRIERRPGGLIALVAEPGPAPPTV
ncbi:MAG: DNA-processing protein DprA [Pseudomonadota bacterium]